MSPTTPPTPMPLARLRGVNLPAWEMICHLGGPAPGVNPLCQALAAALLGEDALEFLGVE